MTKRMLIQRAPVLKSAEPDAPKLDFPTIGSWYAGVTNRGTGAVAQYQGWNEFTLGDGTVVDMNQYDYLREC